MYTKQCGHLSLVKFFCAPHAQFSADGGAISCIVTGSRCYPRDLERDGDTMCFSVPG